MSVNIYQNILRYIPENNNTVHSGSSKNLNSNEINFVYVGTSHEAAMLG
jgi:hypothetical protein